MKILNAYCFYAGCWYVSTKLLTILWVFLSLLLPLVSKAQSATTYTPLGKSLQTLPLDTVLVKLGDAIQAMNGPNDAQIKQELMTTLARAKATNQPLYLAKANQLLANWHYRSVSSENKDSIYHYDNQALTFFLKTNKKELIVRAYRTLGMDLDDMQKYAEAEEVYFKGLKLAQSIGFQSGINSIHSVLSILYSHTKDFDSALKYAKMVVEAYEKDKNYHPLIRALISLNDIYLQLEQPQKSLESINKAYSLISKLPQESQTSETLNVRAWRAKIYRTLKRYDEALEDYRFSWQGVQQKYGADKADGWKGGIGSIYHLQGKHAEAIPYLRDYINHFKGKKVNNPEELAQHNFWMAESLKALNQTD
nr:tetratricopeptide repeat protein [Microscillaceae bacterium]